jgi:quercetin dioxygenase-like cupin family protein
MRQILWIGALTIALAGCAPPAQEETVVGDPMPHTTGFTDEGPEHRLVFRPNDIQWRDGPGSLEAGAEYAVLEGDPGEHVVFNMRLRLPDGFHIAPHNHPRVERVTVISGAFLLGHGEEADRDAAERLEAGSYFAMPPGMTHYAFAEGETVIQLKTIGPWEINYVNSEDDPRLRN